MFNEIMDCNSGRTYVNSTANTNLPMWKLSAIVDEASKEKKPSFVTLVLTTLAHIF
ncbi:MAG: hypothetical protein K6E46_02060 [Lachnospiraceae bacterium]|nr:hypothetical protein [Lachnospiraceae bacterium]